MVSMMLVQANGRRGSFDTPSLSTQGGQGRFRFLRICRNIPRRPTGR